MAIDIPRIPLGPWIEGGLDWLTSEYSMVTRGISRITQTGIDGLNDALMWLPEWGLMAILAAICWKVASMRLAIGAVGGLAVIWNLGLWNPMIETLTLVVIATLVAVTIAIPVGITAALSQRLYRGIMPVLDFMQTMPAFVYLIPAIPFFGIGSVSAIFATVIFSMPPAIRFTTLGIRQVPVELIDPNSQLWGDFDEYERYMRSRGWSLSAGDRFQAAVSPRYRRRRALGFWAVEEGLGRDGRPDWAALKARNLL